MLPASTIELVLCSLDCEPEAAENAEQSSSAADARADARRVIFCPENEKASSKNAESELGRRGLTYESEFACTQWVSACACHDLTTEGRLPRERPPRARANKGSKLGAQDHPLRRPARSFRTRGRGGWLDDSAWDGGLTTRAMEPRGKRTTGRHSSCADRRGTARPETGSAAATRHGCCSCWICFAAADLLAHCVAAPPPAAAARACSRGTPLPPPLRSRCRLHASTTSAARPAAGLRENRHGLYAAAAATSAATTPASCPRTGGAALLNL